jgi:hypothetical protein
VHGYEIVWCSTHRASFFLQSFTDIHNDHHWSVGWKPNSQIHFCLNPGLQTHREPGSAATTGVTLSPTGVQGVLKHLIQDFSHILPADTPNCYTTLTHIPIPYVWEAYILDTVCQPRPVPCMHTRIYEERYPMAFPRVRFCVFSTRETCQEPTVSPTQPTNPHYNPVTRVVRYNPPTPQ